MHRIFMSPEIMCESIAPSVQKEIIAWGKKTKKKRVFSRDRDDFQHAKLNEVENWLWKSVSVPGIPQIQATDNGNALLQIN